MKKQASPAPVEIQTDSNMLEIRMQGVYSLLQLAIVFTCQLYQTRLLRVWTSGIHGPPRTSIFSAVRWVDGEAVRWWLAAATGGRPR
jgi:hypothetical protein